MTTIGAGAPVLPRVSIVIPARNEAAFIGPGLEAVLAQDYPADRLEILVADGRSIDATREIVTDVADRVSRAGGATRVELVDNPEHILPTGVNAAIQRSSGDVIVLFGAHARMPADYVRRCVAALFEHGADAVGGAVDAVGTGLVGEAIAAVWSSPFGLGDPSQHATSTTEPREVGTIPFGAYRRSVFERVGLFNPHLVRQQDHELNHRVRIAGGRLLLLPSLRATYYVRSSLGALVKQSWANGVWRGRFHRRFPRTLRLESLLPSLFVLALGASGLASAPFPPLRVVFWAVVGGYVGLVLVALGALAARGRWAILLVVPVVMPCLHLGHGLGLWVGLSMPAVPDAPRFERPPRA
jgi:cellulose synthase/poly-beta-1,6-N-acetylglucosamine synthase-like glycosyltransferase